MPKVILLTTFENVSDHYESPDSLSLNELFTPAHWICAAVCSVKVQDTYKESASVKLG